ncbi:hypothetical protein QMA69_05330 [Burkholderia pseudomallei]|uniref:hypothetical protein n=1 Tax=Burkholderia pseudomallei TaxID=28450 RepID=UPI002DBE3842|nr:hypothetical protein [Burkholderia pseudomallei]MEB5483948.1 hypothetical protein [Burkholderia pseudomallei]MEB5490797.1 hypothetical protein [Burkholderia pseudomallei]MEB5497499.1 hypothetical protein [Burkholderia pseudomallei]MEB5502770.1 hypothetical protein [Burkholderia pseudomallei]MEB5510150.1 hypothetical protein [Burkholderia pseudomallei]
MTINFDAQSIDVSCPKCGEKIQETLGRLKKDPTLVRPSCNSNITIDASEFREAELSIKRQLDDLMKSFGKLR